MDEDSKAAAWTFVGMILAFKVVTSIIIFVMAPTAHAFIFLLVMQWYWLLLPIPLIAVPLTFWLRLRRVPDLTFLYDESIAGQDRIEQLLKEIRTTSPTGSDDES